MSGAIQTVLEQAVAQEEIAGGALGVFREGQAPRWYKAGYADRAAKRPFEADTIVRLYSATKPITAAAAMLLMEQGRLDPGACLSEILPEYAEQPVARGGRLEPAARPILIRDLLNMTSGLPYGGNPSSASSAAVGTLFEEMEKRLYTDSALTTREVAARLAACPLDFQPGARWMYGTGADVLGAVIEQVSGCRFGAFLRKEFFEPLEMADTDFFVPPEKQGRLAKVYQKTKDGLALYEGDNLAIRRGMDAAPAFESGGAGLASTLTDYRHFAQMLLDGGVWQGRRILAPRTVAYLTAGRLLPWQQTDFNQNWAALSGYTYGNLMRVLEEPRQAAALGTRGEYGWDGWLGFYFINSPADRLTMLLAIQQKDMGTATLTRKLENLVWLV